MLVAVTLALRGYVVAFPHHSDLSSSLCEYVDPKTKETKRLLYKHPNFHNYDTELRQDQVEWRAKEVNEARAILLKHPQLGKVRRDKVWEVVSVKTLRQRFTAWSHTPTPRRFWTRPMW